MQRLSQAAGAEVFTPKGLLPVDISPRGATVTLPQPQGCRETTAHLGKLQDLLQLPDGIIYFMAWRKHKGAAGTQGKSSVPEGREGQSSTD